MLLGTGISADAYVIVIVKIQPLSALLYSLCSLPRDSIGPVCTVMVFRLRIDAARKSHIYGAEKQDEG